MARALGPVPRRLVPAATLALTALLGAPAGAPAATAPLTDANAVLTGPQAGSLAGSAVANAGDVNGDGIGDVVVGAYNARTSEGTNGAAYVVFGSATIRTIDLASLGDDGFEIRGELRAANAGASVAGGGDVNGDGLDDVVVGSPRWGRAGEPFAGEAFVVFGKRDTAPVSLASPGDSALRIEGPALGATWTGTAVGIAPDMNGDGRAEVVVGEGSPGSFRVTVAEAYVVFGRGPGTVQLETIGDAGFEIRYPYTSGEIALAGSRDVNGDGRGDVVVGLPGTDYPFEPGLVYVVFGRSATDPVELDDLRDRGFSIRAQHHEEKFGAAVAAAGDANGDGLGDIVVGAPGTYGRGFTEPAAYVVYGAGDLTQLSTAAPGARGYRVRSSQAGDGLLRPGDALGSSVAGAGDMNGDGRDDVLIGAPYATPGGAAFVVYSPPEPRTLDVSDPATATQLAGGQPADEAGIAVAGGRDATGDGRPDAIVGAWRATAARGHTGEARIVSLPAAGGEPASATVDSRLVPLGRGEVPVTDGRRWAVFTTAAGPVRVYDTRTAKSFGYLPGGCAPTAVASELALFDCGGDPRGVRILDLRTRRDHVVEGPRLGYTEVWGWYAVGRHWIQGGLSCYHCTSVFFNWRTGKTKFGASDIDATVCRDLDSPKARRIACPPFGAFVQREGRFSIKGSVRGPLTLTDGRRRIVLSRCKPRCHDPKLVAGRVTWLQGDALHGYIAASRRRARWPLPRFWDGNTYDPGFPTVTRIGPHVLVSTPGGPVGGWAGPRRVYRARW